MADKFILGFPISEKTASSELVQDGSNIGIGTDDPISGFKLDVVGGFLRVANDAATTGLELGYSAGGSTAFIQGYNRTTNVFTDMIINNSVTVKANGNVGIGTDTFASTSNLQLKMGNIAQGAVGEIFDADDNADSSRLIIGGGGGGSPQFSMRHYSAGYGVDIWISTTDPWNTHIDNRNANSGFIFRNNCNTDGSENELMRIDGSGNATFEGNVGIGTTPSAAILHVYKSSSSPTIVARFENPSGQSLVEIKSVNNNLGVLQFGDGEDGNVGAVQYDHAGNSMRFKTADTERMRITSAGKVIIGNSSISNTGKFGYTPGVGSYKGVMEMFHSTTNLPGSGFVNFFRDSSVIGSIGQSGTTQVSYNISSDYRLKEDLKDFAGLDMVSKIPVYDFKWKTDESRSYGVMAHELQEVLPQAVTGEKDAEETQQVDYSKIVPLLVKSIQELKAEIELLKAR